MRRFRPSVEVFEPRLMPTLVFIFNGDGYAAAMPDAQHTQLAAVQLAMFRDRSVQLATPPMNSPRAFYAVAHQIRAISKGQPIGLMGFSAGGGLALRLAGISSLNVQAVMNYYGPPDLRDWLRYHNGDQFYQWVTTHVHLDNAIIKLLSGVSDSQAYMVSAFGREDDNVVASMSTTSFDNDFPGGHVYDYDGPHQVSLFADYAAFKDFVAHL